MSKLNDIFVRGHEARVNITYQGQNGDLPEPVRYAATDAELLTWVTEAVRAGVPGIAADRRADFTDFVIDRFAATETRPYHLIQIRPATPFG